MIHFLKQNLKDVAKSYHVVSFICLFKNFCLNLFTNSKGEEYIPFNEMPELKNIVLTGQEDNAIGDKKLNFIPIKMKICLLLFKNYRNDA